MATKPVELCDHKHKVCPKHKGNYDCHSFCDICEGDQEYCPQGCEIALDENDYLIYVKPNKESN